MRRPALLALLAASGCGYHLFEAPAPGAPLCNPSDDHGSTAIAVRMAFGQEGDDFFASPFPSLARTADCSLDSDRFPAGSLLLQRMRALTRSDGYALTAGVFFALTGPPDPALLPPPFTRPTASAPPPPVFLFRLDAGPGQGELHPVNVGAHTPDHGYGAAKPPPPHLLSLLPVQGVPLEASATYVAVVQTSLAAGLPGGPTDACGIEERVPACARDRYREALSALAARFALPCSQIAALAVFRTGDPTAELREVFASARADFDRPPLKRDIPLAIDRTRCPGADYCIFTGTVEMPQYQEGTPPYAPFLQWGGGWKSADADGRHTPVSYAHARVVLTLPRRNPMPPNGFPVIVLARTGAGGTVDPLVDRGPILPPTCGFTECNGPGELYARAGYAGLTVDGPLVGASRTDPLLVNEDVAVYNLLNPIALRDNLRQSAVELALVPELLDRLHLDAADCPGLDPAVRLDGGHLALFAHSMGAAVAPLALSVQPKYGAVVLSGSGGSYILKAIYQSQPVPLGALASLFGYQGACTPHARDPEVSLLQWALEPSDAQIYARAVTDGRHALVIEGMIDHYTRAPIADTLILGAGLDLGVTPGSCEGRPDCDVVPEPNGCAPGVASTGYPSIERLLPLTAHRPLDLPVEGNRTAPDGKRYTALVVQHRAPHPDGCPCVDGHEVAYEVDLARHQQECFLAGFAADRLPRVPAGGALFGACE